MMNYIFITLFYKCVAEKKYEADVLKVSHEILLTSAVLLRAVDFGHFGRDPIVSFGICLEPL